MALAAAERARVTLPDALRAAIDLLHKEKRPVFLVTGHASKDLHYRLSPSTEHPRGFQIWLRSVYADAVQWQYMGNFDVSDILLNSWSVE